MNKRILSVGLVAALGLALAACGKEETPAAAPAAPTTTAPAVPATPSAAPPATAPAPVASSAEDVGIAECDDYLRKYEACLSGNVPDEARAALQQSLDATRTAWRQAAANNQSAEALRGACIQAHESTRASLQAYGCTSF